VNRRDFGYRKPAEQTTPPGLLLANSGLRVTRPELAWSHPDVLELLEQHGAYVTNAPEPIGSHLLGDQAG
jgi:hypothetical protein